jgi:hypothetical protein
MLESESITSYNWGMSKIDLLSLRPTQFALGMLEVETKVRKLRKLSDDELKDYLKEHPVPARFISSIIITWFARVGS